MRSNVKIMILCGDDGRFSRFSEILLTLTGNVRESSDIRDVCAFCPGIVVMCGQPCERIAEIREDHTMPVMYIAEKADELTLITAVSKGADIVIPRDISDIEFFARVKALLRRAENPMITEISRRPLCDTNLSFGELNINTSARTVSLGEEKIRTTATEYNILEFLMKNIGRVCSAEEICKALRKENTDAPRKIIAEHIRRIRNKIEQDPKHPVYIQMVFGNGYIFGRERAFEKTA